VGPQRGRKRKKGSSSNGRGAQRAMGAEKLQTSSSERPNQGGNNWRRGIGATSELSKEREHVVPDWDQGERGKVLIWFKPV